MTQMLLALLLSPAWAGPVDRALEDAAARNRVVVERRDGSIDKVPMGAAILRSESGSSWEMNVYAGLKGAAKAVMVYTLPAFGETLAFDPIVSKRFPFPDIFKDGVPSLAVHGRSKSSERASLTVLRYQKPGFKKLATLPNGQLRDLDRDGVPEIVSESLPLGQFFTASCEGFETMAQAARRREIHRFQDGKLLAASSSFPEYFRDALELDSEKLERMLPTKDTSPGPFLSQALTVYFDYAALGRGKEGWQRFTEEIRPSRRLPGVDECLRQITGDLRAKLSIPSDW